ncbi:eukaryotic translation initiation factor 5B-like [Argopecten irradians]|uniref:eukaryotic translation initiation factor 5B-like n=1 Tax=Argopecten irradians TaxID=31199 RepID=UPI0037214185
MDRKLILPKAVVFIMFLSCALSFTIRKRSHQNPADLTRALKVLQRQRRRVDMSDYLRNNLDDMQEESYNPYEEYGGLGGSYNLEDLLPAYQQYLDELEEEGEQEIPNRTPSLDELKSLFGTSEKDHDSILDEAVKVKDNSHPASRKITKSQMEKLLSQVKDAETQDSEEKAEAPSVIEETGNKEQAEGATKPEVVSKEELKGIFGSDESSESDNATPAESKDTADDSSSNGEEIVPQINSFPSEKKKKVAKRDNAESLRSEKDDLQNEIALLRLMEGIEDQEIDNLASALKEATLSQMDGTDSYLRPEYKDIEEAIKNEEILQQLKSNPSLALQIASLAQLAEENGLNPEEDEEEEIDDVDDDDVVDKRTDTELDDDDEKPTYEDGMGRWYENPLPDDEGEIEDKEAQHVLERFAKQYLQRGDSNGNQIDLRRRNGGAMNDEAVREALSEYLASQPDDLDTPNDIEESCLAVDLLNTNCEIADKMGLPIDDEARELCNRHELCYLCGKGHGMTKSQCDQGFGSEVIEICGPNKSCIRDGAQFLWLIKSGQRYSSRPLDECRDPCVRDYILGL